MPYQNYHRHSYYSNLYLPDSVASNEDYCKRAVELGHTIISSCEHGTQGNYRECCELAQKYGLKWAYVTEAYFVKDRFATHTTVNKKGKEEVRKDSTNAHMIIAAKTEKGIGDINEALSEANITGFYNRPRVDLDILLSLSPEDVFITTACVGGIWEYGEEEAESLVRILHAHFRDSFMLEVQYHNTDSQKKVNQFILNLYRKYGIPLIAGMDSHYIYPEEKILRDMRLEANGVHYDNEEGWYMDYPSDEEAYQRFINQGILSPAQINEAMRNTNIFLTFEDVKFDKSKKLPTIYPGLTQEERNQKYIDLVYEKWNKYKKDVDPAMWPVYEDGIRYEVNTITSTNTSDYFLMDYAIVRRGIEKGGMLTKTGRGSGPSFFTNTLLGFSSIDRFAIPVTMYPDRFISADRLKAGSMPDLDLNVGNPEVFAEAQAEVMGEWHSAPMLAYDTMQRSKAWKMYCRANDVPYDIANTMSERLKAYELDVKHADDDEKEDIDVFSYIPKEYHEYLRMSEKYLGIVDHAHPHPCAYLVYNGNIKRDVGLFRITSKTTGKVVYAAFIDGAQAEAYGYLKNDLLKVDVVKVNADIYARIGIPQPSVPELMKMVDGDKETWSMYANGYTMGLNQVEKTKTTAKVMRYKPTNLSEMSAFVAGVRPAFQSMLNTMLDRKHFDYGIPALDNLLQTKEMPSSFILYQEQMMKVLQYGGFSAPQSYSSIKAIAKKHPEKVLPLKEKFLEGFSKQLISAGTDEKVSAETANKVWVIISDACGYGFNSCLTGDTKMYRPSCGNGFVPTIEEMYRIKHSRAYAKESGHSALHKKYKREGYGKALSLCNDGRIRENQIVDIYDQGIRPIYILKTASGKSVRCTANHKFPVGSYDNLVKLADLRVGDKLFVMGEYTQSPIGIPSYQDEIVSIQYAGEEHVYDVEMNSPYHNFVLEDGLVTGNSHSVAVALDSLYTAWAKAHYPYETYAALMSNYMERGDKDKIAAVRAEMKKAFGIKISSARFRQDNRSYFIDKERHEISDALSSIKNMGKRVADVMYAMRDKQYISFTDLLIDLDNSPYVNATAVNILIRMGYFEEFGSPGKLLKMYGEFTDGKYRYTKNLKEATLAKRLPVLRQMEADLPDEEIEMGEQLCFEIEHFGTPLSVFPTARGCYAVLDVDDKYSPKIWMYNVASGTTGMMKVRKPLYNQNPMKPGNVIDLLSWKPEPSRTYANGQSVIKPGEFDNWIKSYKIVSNLCVQTKKSS